MSVCVVGSTGFLGLNVVDGLLASGVRPTAIHRRRAALTLRARKVPQARADLLDPVALRAALDGHDVVVHAAAHYPADSLDRDGTLALAMRQSDALLDACADVGTRRLIMLSSTATAVPHPDRASTEADVFTAPPGYGVYHDVKWTMEQRFLQEDRLEVVVACPAACLGPWDMRVGTSAPLVAMAHNQCPPLPDGWVAMVDARDVGRAVAALAAHGTPPKRVLLSGGTVRLHDWLTGLADRYGVDAPPPPLSDADAIAAADEAEERVAREGGRAIPARELVDLVIYGQRIDASLAETTLDMVWTPLSDTLDAFDTWARKMRVLPPLTPRRISA